MNTVPANATNQSSRQRRRDARKAARAAAMASPDYFAQGIATLHAALIARAEKLHLMALRSDDHASVAASLEEIDTAASSMAETSLVLCDIADTLEARALLLASEPPS